MPVGPLSGQRTFSNTRHNCRPEPSRAPAMIALFLLLASPASLPSCQANQLSLAFDSEGGAFDGMSQSGALLVIRNIGPSACTIPGLPKLTFKDTKGRALSISRKVPPGMHPGPVILPVGIAPDAEVTAKLHWVSGAVYDHSHCLATRFAAISIASQSIQAKFAAHICGPSSANVTFDQPVLRADPRLD
ncbi:DUF4232 domain-containing protein [Sphingomonas koreensis]|nr:DUF4232 domain-containing protein [Sphingomonas koreensis]